MLLTTGSGRPERSRNVELDVDAESFAISIFYGKEPGMVEEPSIGAKEKSREDRA
jgi:hypothetical protein